jgi:hypothetical protein
VSEDRNASSGAQRSDSTFLPALATVLAAVVGTALVVSGVNIGSKVQHLDVEATSRVLSGLAAHQSTPRGYDLALSIAKDAHASEADLVGLVHELAWLLVIAGAAFLAIAGMLLYAAYRRRRECRRTADAEGAG